MKELNKIPAQVFFNIKRKNIAIIFQNTMIDNLKEIDNNNKKKKCKKKEEKEVEEEEVEKEKVTSKEENQNYNKLFKNST